MRAIGSGIASTRSVGSLEGVLPVIGSRRGYAMFLRSYGRGSRSRRGRGRGDRRSPILDARLAVQPVLFGCQKRSALSLSLRVDVAERRRPAPMGGCALMSALDGARPSRALKLFSHCFNSALTCSISPPLSPSLSHSLSHSHSGQPETNQPNSRTCESCAHKRGDDPPAVIHQR